MKKKDELTVDLGLAKLGIKPHIHHFLTVNSPFFAGITIATDGWSSRAIMHTLLDVHLNALRMSSIMLQLSGIRPTESATRLLTILKEDGIFGVSICDKRDRYDPQRGRTIAKGRLLKHLKQKEAENGK